MPEGGVLTGSKDHRWRVSPGPRTKSDLYFSDVIYIHQYTEGV